MLCAIHLLIGNHTISFTKIFLLKSGLSSEDTFKFSDIVEMQGQTGRETKNIFDGKEMIENVNETRSETE